MIEIDHNYPVVVGESIIQEVSQFVAQQFPEHQLFILVDENTEEHCLPALNWSDYEGLLHAEVLSVPAGEESKCLAIVERLAATLIELGAPRKTLLINLGGGMITDLGGFLAATYKRGIPFINIPTSLLAMVDASVGGKTAVNVGSFKNQVGSFYFPEAVFCGIDFLDTLPERELKSGWAEVIKHGLIAEPSLWNSISSHPDLPAIEESLLAHSIQVKARIVEKDPKEGGERKKLNFGHTVGHALESLSHQMGNPILHGEAVALGILVESWIAHTHFELDSNTLDAIYTFIRNHYELYSIEESDFMPLLDYMQADKKNENMAINFSLIDAIGSCQINLELSEVEVEEALIWYRNLCV